MRKFKIYILLLTIVFSGCFGNKKIKNSNISVNKKSHKWIVYSSKDSIPRLLNLVLKSINKNDSEIADFNGKFYVGCIRRNDLPSKQLCFLSKKQNKWRISYAQGGFGKYYVYAECKIVRDSIYDFKIAQSQDKLENNDTINKLLSENKINLKKVKLIYE